MKKYKNGLVLGKFYPTHLGHLYLIDTALNNSEKVDVMVCHHPTQSINGELRVDCLKKIYGNNSNITIHSVDDRDLPQHDTDCHSKVEFYDQWVKKVYSTVYRLDVVFTSEEYGDDFAHFLGIDHFLVDKERIRYNISGTKIRENPHKYWEFIPKEIRPNFVYKVSIMGPESVGKSVLTKRLSDFFNTNYVEEYGRTIWELYRNNFNIDHFKEISIGRQELEDIQIKKSNKVIFSDTEELTTYIFSKMYFPDQYKKYESWFIDRISKQKFDLYILLKPDCESIQDGTRQYLDERESHYEVIKNEMNKYNFNYIEIGGDWENRYNESKKYLSKILWME